MPPARPDVLPHSPLPVYPQGAWGRLLRAVARLGRAPFSLRLALGSGFFGLALWSRFALGDDLPTGFPFLTFFPAVLMTAALLGLGPALLVSLLSVLSAWYWFLKPVEGFSFGSPELIAVGFFSAILLIDCLVIHGLKTALMRVSLAERRYRRAQAELLEREVMLRAADAQKDVFLATLAHELRNPLAPIRSAAELIRLRQPGDEPIRHAGAVIERQVMHMSHLVDDLLDVSRLTRGTIELRSRVLDLRGVTAHAIETLKPVIDMAGLQLTQHISAEPVLVQGDATRLGQCVMNLLTNAAKFTPRGGSISLQLSQHGGWARVEVQDSGLGIEEANLERIFELFVQERPSGLNGHSGLGLGLAITRKLAMLHGGSVVASSLGRGKGSSFWLDLPTCPAAASTPLPKVPAPQSVPQPEPAKAGTAAHHNPVSMGPGQPQRGSLLVIEDNADAADLLGQILQLHGFTARLAHTGEAGLAMAGQAMPDAVLLDIGLPDLDGYDVCRRLRGMPQGQQPVVIALTGWGTGADRERASEAGCDAHLTKPADPDALLALLDELLQARTPAAQPA